MPTRRYDEAFWWVVPIPAAVVAGAVVAVIRPSTTGLIALGLLALAGSAVEMLFVRTFQRRWAGDPGAHPTSGVPDPLRRPGQAVLGFGLLIAAIAWKAVGLGQSWVAGVLTGAGFVALVLAIAGIRKVLGFPRS